MVSMNTFPISMMFTFIIGSSFGTGIADPMVAPSPNFVM